MIPAAAVRSDPFHTRHQLDDFQLFNFVIEPADLRFLEVDPAPLIRVGLGQSFDDLNDFGASRHALFLQTKKSLMRRSTGLAGILEHAMPPLAEAASGHVTISAAAAVFLRHRSRGIPRCAAACFLAKAAKNFRDHIADQSFIYGIHAEMRLMLGVINFLAENIHTVDDSNNHSVHRRILEIWGESGGTALAEHP